MVYFTNPASRTKQIYANTPRESNRLMFTLQSGSPAILKKHNVLQAFLCFSDVSCLFYKTGITFSWVEFRSADAYAKASNLLLPMTTSTGVWELHTFKDFNMAKIPKDPFPHQILLESNEMPTSLENLIIVKDFFKKFGEVHLRATVPLVLVKISVPAAVPSWALLGHWRALLGHWRALLGPWYRRYRRYRRYRPSPGLVSCVVSCGNYPVIEPLCFFCCISWVGATIY